MCPEKERRKVTVSIAQQQGVHPDLILQKVNDAALKFSDERNLKRSHAQLNEEAPDVGDDAPGPSKSKLKTEVS